MSAAVALLRGINIGRNKRLAMSDLRSLLRELGHPDATTYLQSGNVCLPNVRAGLAETGAQIEAALARDMGLNVSVVMRSADELAAVVAANPFAAVADDPARHLVLFLAETADPRRLTLTAADFAPERYRLVGREIHLWCPNGVQNSRLAALRWEDLLGGPATARNWNTVTKLLGLVSPAARTTLET